MIIFRISLFLLLLQTVFACHTPHEGSIMTVNGKIAPTEMGLTLHHEHVLVDFFSADSVEPPRYNRQEALKIILTQINRLKSLNKYSCENRSSAFRTSFISCFFSSCTGQATNYRVTGWKR